VIVDRAVYAQGARLEGDAAAADAFVWVALLEPTHEEFDAVRREFDLHELAVEDAVKAHQRPKLERYGDTLFIVLKTVVHEGPEDMVETGELMLFVGPGFLVTVRHGHAGGVGRVREGLERRPERAVAPLAGVVDELTGDETLVHDEIRTYLRDVADHVVRLNEQLEGFRELLAGILQANLTRVSVRQNEDMRKISAWIAIVAVPTAVAGIYGMNFDDMPELGWRWGYPAVLTLIAVVCLYLYARFRRSGWL
jgi:Mg2+ and Co2+ transporter CorA